MVTALSDKQAEKGRKRWRPEKGVKALAKGSPRRAEVSRGESRFAGRRLEIGPDCPTSGIKLEVTPLDMRP